MYVHLQIDAITCGRALDLHLRSVGRRVRAFGGFGVFGGFGGFVCPSVTSALSGSRVS